MQTVNVTVKTVEGPQKVSFEKDYGTDLQEACELFGEEAVYTCYLRQVSTDDSNYVRSAVNGGKATIEQALERVASRKPGVKMVGAAADPLTTLSKQLSGLSPEELEAKKAEIRALLGI